MVYVCCMISKQEGLQHLLLVVLIIVIVRGVVVDMPALTRARLTGYRLSSIRPATGIFAAADALAVRAIVICGAS